jgi:hypothetical protein
MFQTSTTTINLWLRRTLLRSVILIVKFTNVSTRLNSLIPQSQYSVCVAQMQIACYTSPTTLSSHYERMHRWFVPHHDKRENY